jgi:hypothetical protein
VKLVVEQPLRGFAPPFEMLSIRASVIAGRGVPGDSGRPVPPCQGAQKREFQSVSDISGVLITHPIPEFAAVVICDAVEHGPCEPIQPLAEMATVL